MILTRQLKILLANGKVSFVTARDEIIPLLYYSNFVTLEFCPADCDWSKETMCTGMWNDDWTEQMTADYCIPNKVGDCINHCPMNCGQAMVCPGKMDDMGCKMPDMCFPAGKECPKM